MSKCDIQKLYNTFFTNTQNNVFKQSE